MANTVVDGFATYGTASLNPSSFGSDALNEALLAGAYAEIPTFGRVSVCEALPWDAANTSFWMAGVTGGASTNTIVLRRVLPAAVATFMASFHAAVESLPGTNSRIGPMDFRNDSNAVIGTLYVQSTGSVAFDYTNGIATSSGPVITAETDQHWECKLDTGAGAFQLYVDGTKVIDITGVTLGAAGDVAQVGLAKAYTSSGGDHYPLIFITDLVLRDTSGTYNHSFPIGDRRVATLFPNSDDEAHQGWTAEPLHRFGTGILDLTVGNTSTRSPNTILTDIGANDFTIEGQFRFQALPTGSNKAVLYGKWDETSGNLRSYQLYLGGPSLENGLLVFRTSTDGQSGTVSEKYKWNWAPDVGRWYHVAMVRASGELILFIDGVQQGVPVADSDTYFAGTARAAIGGQSSGTNSTLANTSLDGWQDEFRLTIGVSRYNANFTPPSDGFPRGADDPDWADVAWLSSWDNGSVADDGPNGMTLSGGTALTPDDGDFAYQTINKPTPDDDTFIEAALIAAFGTLTLSANAGNTETVTVGTTDGSTAAVYTFKTAISTAFDVLIGATALDSVNNLVAAINKAAGEGTLYGTGTTANADVSAETAPSGQMIATALTPGTGGNSIASTETLASGSWGGATLAGGENIPGYSQFGFQRMPSGTTIVDSVTFQTRQWKTDAGSADTQMSFVGAEGGVANGTERPPSATPTLYFDTFEEDPDTSSGMTPSTILGGKIRVDRTV